MCVYVCTTRTCTHGALSKINLIFCDMNNCILHYYYHHLHHYPSQLLSFFYRSSTPLHSNLLYCSAAGFGLLLACGVTAIASYGVAYKYPSPDFPTSVITDMLLFSFYRFSVIFVSPVYSFFPILHPLPTFLVFCFLLLLLRYYCHYYYYHYFVSSHLCKT